MSDRRSFWPRIEIEEVSVCTDEQTMRGGWGSPNEGSEGTKCKRGRETVINMNESEQMPIMDMNNQREGGAAWCHRWHGMGNILGPGSRSATEGGPESSSLSTMPIIDISPLNLVVVNPHRSCAGHRASGAACSVGASVLVLLPIQERVGWIKCWIRPISTILSQGGDASIIPVPVRTGCGGVCIWVRCGKTAISSRLLLRLVLALPSAGGDQWLYAGVPIRRSSWLLGSPPARLDLDRRGPHDERCAR